MMEFLKALKIFGKVFDNKYTSSDVSTDTIPVIDDNTITYDVDVPEPTYDDDIPEKITETTPTTPTLSIDLEPDDVTFELFPNESIT